MYYRLSTKKTKSKNRRPRREPTNIRRKVKLIIVFAIIFVLIFAFVQHYLKTTRPLILKTAEATITATTTLAVNQAVLDVMSSNINYQDLVSIEKNDSGDIVLMECNSQLINNLAQQTAISVQSSINELGEVGVEIAIGTLTGLPLLTGKGGSVSISVQPVGEVVCTFVSNFTSAGINQTLHQIYLTVDSDITILLPTMQKVVESSVPVLVAESIIIGKVPDVYLQGTILGSSSAK